MDIDAINNMLRHGLKSESDIPMTERPLYMQILQEYCQIYEPQSQFELALVHKMAFAVWKMNLGDRLYFERIDYERSIAPEVFRARDEAQFKKHFRQYLKDSETAYGALCSTITGREYFIRFLSETLALVETGDSNSGKFNAVRIWELMRATGQSARAQNVSSEPGLLLISAISYVMKPGQSVRELLSKIFSDRLFLPSLVDYIQNHLLTPEAGRMILVKWINMKIQSHNEHLAVLRNQAEGQIQMMIDTQAGFGMGDPKLYKAASILCTFLEKASDEQLDALSKLNDIDLKRRKQPLRTQSLRADRPNSPSPHDSTTRPKLYKP